jgi:hypothetical protein
VVTASREFICVRPQTYEDKEEAALLVSLFSGRSGNLENTVFCVMSPGGKSKLSGSGRSPSMRYDDAADFAAFLSECFTDYAKGAKAIKRLPVLDELALAMNVASCDLMPLVILNAKTERELEKLEQRVAELAWADGDIGKQHYFSYVGKEFPIKTGPSTEPTKSSGKESEAADEEPRNAIEAFVIEPGLTVIQPGPYGRTATILKHASVSAKSKDLAATLAAAREAHDPATKVRTDHVRNAKREGIKWEPELPVTDSKAERKKGERE